nr:mediator of RNA polymerase II transcription subunit 33A-like [Tanacetum cinerariifolium]
MTKTAQTNGTDALIWSIAVKKMLSDNGVLTPSTEVAELLVNDICWSSNVSPMAWKYLEKALVVGIVSPLFVLALLSESVIPRRRSQPAAYRLYLELLRRHVVPLASEVNGPMYRKIMESIDDVLHLSQRFSILSKEPGLLLVEFVFAIVWQLLDASLDDEGLLELVPEKKSTWSIKPQEMEIDDHIVGEKKMDRSDRLYKTNITLAIEIMGELYRNKVTSRILYLARLNM